MIVVSLASQTPCISWYSVLLSNC